MRATSLLLVLATAGLAAACGGKPAPEEPAPEPTPAPAPAPAPAPVDDSAERERLGARAAWPARRPERARAVAADLAAMINFEYDQAAVRAADQGTLDTKAAILAANPNVQLQISGHADERGSDEYNLALGNRRAAAAKRYLENKGIDGARLEVVSYGEERPLNAGSRRGGLRPEPSRRVPGDGRRRQPRRSAVSSSNGRLAAGLAATSWSRRGCPAACPRATSSWCRARWRCSGPRRRGGTRPARRSSAR